MSEEHRDPEREFRAADWMAPPPTAAFHSRVLGAFEREFGRAPWWRRWPIVLVPVAGAVVFLLVVTQAYPQSLRFFSPRFQIPYVVEYELIKYAVDGSTTFETHITAFKNGGDQFILTKADSGHPFLNSVNGIVYSARMILLQLAPSLILPSQSNDSVDWNRALVSNGCLGGGETVVGHETVLGHATTIVESISSGHRTTIWLAPDLGCFDLKHINEEQQPDGTFATRLRINAIRVTVNP